MFVLSDGVHLPGHRSGGLPAVEVKDPAKMLDQDRGAPDWSSIQGPQFILSELRVGENSSETAVHVCLQTSQQMYSQTSDNIKNQTCGPRGPNPEFYI